MDKIDGGAAFPRVVPLSIDRAYESGMSLRDYFAGQAILGILHYEGKWEDTIKIRAQLAYQLADAMLKEKEK